MKEALIESTKEFFRVCVLAAIPVVIDGLAKGMVDFRVVAITAAIAGLRFVDKVLHELGKEKGNDTLTKGLTRF